MSEEFWYVALFASVFAAFLCGVLLGQLMKAGSVVKYLLRNKG
jgi:hypothetical protein